MQATTHMCFRNIKTQAHCTHNTNLVNVTPIHMHHPHLSSPILKRRKTYIYICFTIYIIIMWHSLNTIAKHIYCLQNRTRSFMFVLLSFWCFLQETKILKFENRFDHNMTEFISIVLIIYNLVRSCIFCIFKNTSVILWHSYFINSNMFLLHYILCLWFQYQ